MALSLEELGLEREELRKKLQEKRRNREFINSEREDLRKEYPDMYVGVFNGEVVAASKSFDEVIETLRKKAGGDISAAEVELITSKDIVWIL